MNGPATAQAIRNIEKDKKLQPTVIIGLTAKQEPTAHRLGLLAGMNAIYTKPIRIETLKEALKLSCQQQQSST